MRVWIAMCVGLLAGMALGVWLVRPDAQAPRTPAAEPATTATLARVEAATASGAPANAPAGVNPKPVAPAPPLAPEAEFSFDPVSFRADWQRQMDELIRRAAQNDGSALRDLAERSALCERMLTGALNVDGRAARQVQQFLQEFQRECRQRLEQEPLLQSLRQRARDNTEQWIQAQRDGQRPAGSAIGPTTLADALYAEAAVAGDSFSQARQSAINNPCLTQPIAYDPASRQARALCMNDLLIQQLTLALGPWDALSIARVGRLQNLSINVRMVFFPADARREVLWTLAACELGLDCGPTGPGLRWACAQGHCGYRHYYAYAADQVLTPRAMRDVQTALPMLLSALRARDVRALLLSR